MNDLTVPAPRKLWARLLLMVLLAAAFQLAASVLFFLAAALAHRASLGGVAILTRWRDSPERITCHA